MADLEITGNASSFDEALKRKDRGTALRIRWLGAAEERKLPWDRLPEFSQILTLKMAGLHIKELPQAIAQMPALETLELEETYKLDWVQAFGVLAQAPHLRTLDLYRQKHFDAVPDTLQSMKRLRHLSIVQPNFQEFPEYVCDLIDLESLRLNYKFSTLPESIGRMKGLKELSITSQKLKSLPASLGKLQALERLAICDSNLTGVPSEIGQLAHLRVLDLSKNRMADLPETFGELQSLEELIMYGNGLTKIPSAILRMKKLRELSLFVNRLTEVPAGLAELPNLKILKLGSNPDLDPISVDPRLRAFAEF